MKKVITADDILREKPKEIILSSDTILTPQARELAKSMNIPIREAENTSEELAQLVRQSLGDSATEKEIQEGVKAVLKRLEEGERVIITAMGEDKPGIVAGLSTKIAEFSANIVEISQSSAGDYFTMIIVCELRGANFSAFKKALEEVGGQLGITVLVQVERLFRSMHRI